MQGFLAVTVATEEGACPLAPPVAHKDVGPSAVVMLPLRRLARPQATIATMQAKVHTPPTPPPMAQTRRRDSPASGELMPAEGAWLERRVGVVSAVVASTGVKGNVRDMPTPCARSKTEVELLPVAPPSAASDVEVAASGISV